MPIPGSPPTSMAEPRTIPPPVTRSSSAISVRIRGASSISPESDVSATGVPFLACRPGPPPMPPAGLSSTMVFHAPQPSHFPAQRACTVPQLWQTNCVFWRGHQSVPSAAIRSRSAVTAGDSGLPVMSTIRSRWYLRPQRFSSDRYIVPEQFDTELTGSQRIDWKGRVASNTVISIVTRPGPATGSRSNRTSGTGCAALPKWGTVTGHGAVVAVGISDRTYGQAAVAFELMCGTISDCFTGTRLSYRDHPGFRRHQPV